MEDCKKLGAFIFNPHVLTVEGGGLGVVDADQVKAKLRFDPRGLSVSYTHLTLPTIYSV